MKESRFRAVVRARRLKGSNRDTGQRTRTRIRAGSFNNYVFFSRWGAFQPVASPTHEWIKLKTHVIALNRGEPMPHRASVN